MGPPGWALGLRDLAWLLPQQLCCLGELLLPLCPRHTSRTRLVMSRGQSMAVGKEAVEGPAERREGTPQARVVTGPFVQEQRIQCGVGMSQAPGKVS